MKKAAAAAISAEAETERERWTGLMLWIHGPGGVGDEVPLEAKKGGSFREPLSTILLTIVLGPGLRALIK